MSHLMAGLALLGAGFWAVWGGPPIFLEFAPQGAGSGQPGRQDVAVAGELHTTASLFDFFFGEPRQRSEPRSERLRPRRYAPSKAVPKDASAYRTLCVRLCDGFYFPISFSTGRERFAADAKQCERQCPSRSRLFVYRNPGEEIENMRDLDGLAYMSLPTALMYRTKYVADCNCKPNPWDEAAQARHRTYAENVKKSAVGKVGKKH
jgi:hypothetical protein